MRKLLVIFGGTGQQGGSVVDFVLSKPELSKHYKMRAITRDPSKPGAQALREKGAEVVKGDLSDPSSLKDALLGAHTIFALTTPFEGLTKDQETKQGKAVADAAVSVGAQYLIWSTLCNVADISNNTLQMVAHFDAKADVETYIRSLPIKSSFFAPGMFMQNFQSILRPRPSGDGSYSISSVVKSATMVPLLDIVGDTGKFVGRILAQPDRYEGQFLAAATKMYSFGDIARIIGEKSGKTVVFKRISDDTMRSALPPSHAAELVEMMVFFREYGYYGSETDKMVEKASNEMGEGLTTFEEYLDKNPLDLG